MISSVSTAFPPGVLFALAAAVLFGASTPVAKVLLGTAAPVLLAALLYLGSGSGLLMWRWLRSWWSTHPPPRGRTHT